MVSKDGELPCSDIDFLTRPEQLKSNPSKGLYVYPFRKFMRSNAGTCMNQTPLVRSVATR